MRILVLLALLFSTPARASTFTVAVTGGALPEQQSIFRERTFPASTFLEKMQQSKGSFSASNSAFGLKDMDEQTRVIAETTLAELGAKPQGGNIIVDLPSDVLFDFDKADIRPDARPVLLKLAGVLAVMTERRVSIVGHTDSKGGDDYNDRLSTRRAASVKSWLLESGVKSKMTTAGQGERFPVAPNEDAGGADNPEGRQLNRRVQLVIEEE